MSFRCSDYDGFSMPFGQPLCLRFTPFFPHHLDEFFLIEQYWAVPLNQS